MKWDQRFFNSLEMGGGGDLRDLGRFFFDFLLLSLFPGDVTVGAIVTDQLFSLIGDMGGDLKQVKVE